MVNGNPLDATLPSPADYDDQFTEPAPGCSKDIGCMTEPCLNHGDCLPSWTQDGYQCVCAQGFTGSTCEQGKISKLFECEQFCWL